MAPEFILYTGPMFSGKTSALLMTLERFKYQGRRIFAFKPRVDDRFSDCEIVSHMGWKVPALSISSGPELIASLLEKTDEGESKQKAVVAVDEMFMIDDIAEHLIWLYKNDVTVVVSTLDKSYTSEPFLEVMKIMPWATTMKKFTSVCTVCQADAHFTWRKQDTGDALILVGGSETYEPRCKRHHPAMFLEQEE